jgi:CTP:molybdopterin cytidylyltransferase MocA
LPVASGIFVAHIDMPDVGKSKILKLAVIAEQQFLENF